MKAGDVKDLLHSGDWSLVIENHGVCMCLAQRA